MSLGYVIVFYWIFKRLCIIINIAIATYVIIFV